MTKLLRLLTLISTSLLPWMAHAADDAQHVDAKQAAELVKAGNVVVLDVRTSEEFEEGHIAGAKNIDFIGQDFGAQAAKLDPTATYLVHCQVGGRSTRALASLKRAGITQLIHMDGGFGDWLKAGLPVEK